MLLELLNEFFGVCVIRKYIQGLLTILITSLYIANLSEKTELVERFKYTHMHTQTHTHMHVHYILHTYSLNYLFTSECHIVEWLIEMVSCFTTRLEAGLSLRVSNRI